MKKQNALKVFLSVVLCAVLVLTVLCCSSFDVQAADYLGSGSFGNDLSWTLDYNGRLTISGNGAIPDYGENAGGNPAWYTYASEIKQILIDDGITSIGDEAFECCYNVSAIVVGKDVAQIGSSAFSDNRSYGIYFTGSAPSFSADTFSGYHLVSCIYYPELEGWSNAAGQNYGSYYSIDWHPAYKPQATTITAAYNKSIGAVEISWEEARYAYEYDVYRKTAGEKEATLLSSYSYVTTHKDYTIEKGIKYTYYVVVRSTEARLSEESNTVSIFQKLDKPEVTASTVAATGRIKLSWKQVEDATGYRIYRSTSKSSGFKAVKLIKSGATTTFTDAGVTAGTKYYYKVVAIHTNSNANSSYSSLAGATANLARPSVTAKNDAKTGKVVLSWKKIAGASGYKVYRSTAENSGYSAIKVIKSGSTTTYTDTGAKAGIKYYYKVMATHSVSSANSAYSTVDSRMADLPYPVVSISNDSDTGKPVLSWKKISGASGYKVYRATSKTGSYKAIKYIKNGTTVTYTDTGAVAGSKYYYKVYAVCEKNTGGNSAYSVIVSGLCDCAKPTIKVSDSSLTSVKLSWKKVSNANGYIVYRASSKNGSYKKVGTVTVASYTDKNVKAGNTYYYKVIAKNSNSGANSKYSNIVSCKATVKAPVLKETVQATKNTLSISWGKVSGANGYYVYRRSIDSSTWKKVATIKSGSTVTYKDSVSAGSYYYCVASYKTSGGKTYVTMLFDSVFTWAVSVPIAWTLIHWTDLGLLPVFTFVNLADFIKLVIGLVLLHRGVWLQNLVADKNL